MPIYEFACRNCETEFELLVRGDEKPTCPDCSTTKLEKQLSIISSPADGTNSEPAPCAMPKCCGGGCKI